MSNRLKDETSPYLRQHADNPVDWYPWGKEAFARARAEDRPILLSIGYSACHWCHVMAHESFEDEATAAQMNRDFINIKVDREEHPDVDQIYQHALQLFGEHGGWPLTMFLTPAGEPFYGGTYFPPRENFGRPSFRRLLSALADAYRTQRQEVVEQGHKLVQALANLEARGESRGAPDGDGDSLARLPADFAERAAAKLALRMDPRQGGFQGAPKFPNPSSLELQLRAFARSGEAEAAQPVLLTLRKMAEGGIYDHLGGGFARYSTDDKWLVPHFEKMLYDNGQLLRLYAEGVQLCRAAGKEGEAGLFSRVIRQTLGWIEREMRDESGGLYAAQDADSEGVEGKYFVWDPQEVEAVCGKEAAAVLCRCYDVQEGGNWQDPHGHGPRGKSILHLVDSPRSDAEERLLAEAMDRLLAARLLRVPPGTDDKVLTGWNGLAITGMTCAAGVLGDEGYLAAARRTADFVLGKLRDESGGLLRTYKHGRARLPGTLDDHAFVAEGLFYLAQATGDLTYLAEARKLTDVALLRFHDPATRAFYLALGPLAAAADEVGLIARPVSRFDSAIPSGASVTCLNLLRLSALLPPAEAGSYREVAERFLGGQGEQALRNPFGLSNLCAAIDLMQHGLTVTVIAGGAEGAEAEALRRAAFEAYVPDHFVLVAPPAGSPLPMAMPILEGKVAVQGRAAAYVCQGQRCSLPVTDPDELRRLLRAPGTTRDA